MKYKRASIRLDLRGVYKFHVEELPWDREDIGETYNAMGFANIYARRSDAEALQLLKEDMLNRRAEHLAEVARDIVRLNELKF